MPEQILILKKKLKVVSFDKFLLLPEESCFPDLVSHDFKFISLIAKFIAISKYVLSKLSMFIVCFVLRILRCMQYELLTKFFLRIKIRIIEQTSNYLKFIKFFYREVRFNNKIFLQ